MILLLGLFWRQRRNNILHVIYYASKTLNNAQMNYATKEKEFLAIIFPFKKFRAYLVGTKVIIYINHSTIKCLMIKQDVKPKLI